MSAVPSQDCPTRTDRIAPHRALIHESASGAHRFGARSFHACFVAALALFLAGVLFGGMYGCGGNPVTISLPAVTAQQGATYQSGQPTAVVLNTSGRVVPTAGNLTVKLTPTSGSAAVTASPTALDSLGGNAYAVHFTVPQLSITAVTSYGIVVSGGGSLTPFTTSPPLVVSIQPVAALVSAAPSSAAQGATVDVTLTAVGTSFATGTTASFGAGIAVGGAAAGSAGPVQVTSPTVAVAHLVVGSTGATGTRDISVTTGSKTLSLAGGFSVTAAAAAPVPPVASAGGPYTGTAGKAVAFSAAGSSDPLGRALTYAWTFGDGSSGSGVAPSHTYATAGTYTASVVVTNADGLSATATAPVTIAAAASQPPVAGAGGPYRGTANTAVAFSAAASTDPKGEALTYAWSFGDGSSGSGVAPTHAYTAAGTYTVTLTVTNTDGLSGSATTSATITAPASQPQPPVANAAGPYTGTTNQGITFSGSGSTDPKGEALTYAWSFGDGGSSIGVSPVHAYTAAGTYAVTLTVTNTDGLTASASTSATITAPASQPQPPVANAGGPYSGTTNHSVSFNGAASSDPKGETLTYAWNFGDGGSGTGISPAHTYTSSGTYTVTLTVTNTDGLSGSATATATVTAPSQPQPPVANAGGPYSGTANQSIAFNGAASSDPKGEALTYAWNFGDGSNGSGATPAHTYAAAGTYTVTLTVTNTDSLTGSATSTATVTAASQSQPPVANAGGPYSGAPGASIAFNGSGSTDPKGEALTYLWTFGDGSTATGASPAHAYVDAGTYAVTLSVTNADNLSATATATATITAPGSQQPVANAGGPYTGITAGTVRFDGTASADPANTSGGYATLAFRWSFGDGGQGVGPSPVHTYAAAGTYTVTVTVTNATGNASASTTATITQGPPVSDLPNVNPGGPYTGARGAAIAFSGAGSSDPQGATLAYTWDFGDGSSADGVSVSHAYTQAGSFSVVLTAGNGSSTNTASTTATVTAPAAQAVQANAGGPYTVAVNQPLTLDGSGTTNPNTRQLLYTWNFGDGTTDTGAKPIHFYTATGNYTVTLSVSDGVVAASTATAAVTVSGPAAEAITASAGGPYHEATGRDIVFDATASNDNLGNTLNFAWDFGDGSTGTGATPTHNYATAGNYTAKVTASSGSVSAIASATVHVANALSVTIATPTANTLFGSNTVTVTGTVSAPNLTVDVNGTAATVSGTGFTANNVPLREGVNLLTATATDGNGGVGTGVVSVLLDVTAPRVSITSPANGAVLTTSQVAVAGLVNDSVTGTIGSNDVSVTVNGVAAQVANRSYLLPSLQLVPGSNTITVVVKDKVGNTSQTTETVQVAPPSSQLSLVKLSGDNQSGATRSVLNQPLVVQLLAANGTPVAGRPITFTVSRSDGNVEVMPTVAQTLYVTTDASGKASVLFQLGTRSGLGVNQVTATTPGASGGAVFTASSTTGTATQIHVVRGEHQRGVLGAPLAEAFQVIVQDAYGNPVPGVTVNYAVAAGDGTFPQQAVTTDSNGKASSALTLGQQEGVNNYTAQVNFSGNTGLPVTFTASGFAAGPVANTSVSGIVLDNANVPVVNATVKLLGTKLMTVSDASGRFRLSGAPVGTVTLSVDGSTSTSTDTLPFLSFVLQDLPGQDNTLGKPVYLPKIDVNNAQTVGGDDPVTLTIAGVPGVGFTIAPHSVTFPDGSNVGKMSLSLVKSDMVPMEPTSGTAPDLIWTLQPAGTRFSVPVQVTLPNTQALPPGYVSEMYQYDHDLEQFVSIGTGHVSPDGSVMVSDAGFGITKAGWGHGAVTPVPGQCTQSCPGRINECITTYSDQYCNCYIRYLPGATCGHTPEAMKCQYPGHCTQFGVCDGGNKPDGTDCHTGPALFCDAFQCKTGQCIDKPVPDQPLGTGNNDTAGNQGSKAQFAFQNVADKISQTLKAIGSPVEIRPILSGSDQVTLICCEAKKQLNVRTREQTVAGGINISSKEFPVISPVPPEVPLGLNIPRLGFQGVFAKVDGDITGNITLREDDCANKSCFKGGLGIGVNGTVGINIQASTVLKLTVSGSIGFGGSATAGCGEISGSLTYAGLYANAQVTFADFFNVTASARLIDGTVNSFSYPLK